MLGAKNSATTIAATSTEAVYEEPRRVKITFVNDSVETIYLSKGSLAVVNTGIRLNANGGSYEDKPTEIGKGIFTMYTGMYTGIATGAGAVLNWIEEVI